MVFLLVTEHLLIGPFIRRNSIGCNSLLFMYRCTVLPAANVNMLIYNILSLFTNYMYKTRHTQ